MMLTQYSNTPCCAVPKQQQKNLFPATFLPATYFLAMVLSIISFAAVLKLGRATGDSHQLLSVGIWGINLLTFCVGSFLYFSEQDSKLKRYFAMLNEGLIYCYMLTFCWSFSVISAESDWPLVLAISATISLLWLRGYCGCKPASVFRAWLFLMTALSGYIGLIAWQQNETVVGASLTLSAVALFAAFMLQSDKKPSSSALLSSGDLLTLRQLGLMLCFVGHYFATYWILAN